MIYENIIPKIYQDELLEFFSSNLFPWRYEPGTTYSKNTKLPLQQNFGNTICLDKNTIDSQQFIHVFLFNGQVQSPALDRVKPILYFLNDRVRLLLIYSWLKSFSLPVFKSNLRPWFFFS